MRDIVFWTRGLSRYREAGSDGFDNKENEWWSPGCFFVVVFENRDEFSVEELRVKGLSDERSDVLKSDCNFPAPSQR